MTGKDDTFHQCDLLCPVAHVMRGVPAFVDPETTLRAAAQAMEVQGDGVAIVLGPDGPSSIVTERDLVSALARQADPDAVWVADVVRPELFVVEPTMSILDAARGMTSAHIRHVPVRDKGGVVGCVASEDVVGLLGREPVGSWNSLVLLERRD